MSRTLELQATARDERAVAAGDQQMLAARPCYRAWNDGAAAVGAWLIQRHGVQFAQLDATRAPERVETECVAEGAEAQ